MNKGAPQAASAAPAVVAVPRAWLAMLTALLIVPWLAVAAWWAWPARHPGASETPTASATDASRSSATSGPWGELIVTPVTISPPMEYVSRTWGEPQPSVWHFPPLSSDELEGQLVSFGLSREDAARLRATARLTDRVPGVFVAPDAALAARLSPEVRARLYLALGRISVNSNADVQVNVDQESAYRYYANSIDEWLGPPLLPETVRLVAPYVYRHAGFLFFADIERIRPLIPDPSELQRLAKRLLRHATVRVEMRVPDSMSVESVADYWGRGGRRTDLRPLLESVARGSGGSSSRTIDISHLLPTLAREHLYRYPRPSVADMERPLLANCLWTALNFFSQRPDDRYLDPAVSLQTLKNDYYIVQDNFQLGDVVAFADRQGNLFHVAVYVADGLLFSKNGTSALAPWSILPLDHFKGHYAEWADDWQITYHRRKDL